MHMYKGYKPKGILGAEFPLNEIPQPRHKDIPHRHSTRDEHVSPRYDGRGCRIEIDILEKHSESCPFRKSSSRSPDDERLSYEIVDRISYKSCVTKGEDSFKTTKRLRKKKSTKSVQNPFRRYKSLQGQNDPVIAHLFTASKSSVFVNTPRRWKFVSRSVQSNLNYPFNPLELQEEVEQKITTFDRSSSTCSDYKIVDRKSSAVPLPAMKDQNISTYALPDKRDQYSLTPLMWRRFRKKIPSNDEKVTQVGSGELNKKPSIREVEVLTSMNCMLDKNFQDTQVNTSPTASEQLLEELIRNSSKPRTKTYNPESSIKIEKLSLKKTINDDDNANTIDVFEIFDTEKKSKYK